MLRDLKNVDLNLLIVFNTLAQEEHLTRTAEKLHLSQPAISNALSRLRELFNDDLFVRASKGMRPTPKARALKQPIKDALEIIQNQLFEPEAFDSPNSRQTFSISVNSYAEFALLPKVIGKLRGEAPNITLNVFPESDGETTEKLRSGELDLAIDYLELPGKDFIAEPFFEEELVVVSAKNYKGLENGLSFEHYNSLPHLSIHPRSHRGSHTEILLGRKQINRKVVMNVSNLVSFPPLIANSDMICTLPRRLAEHFQVSLGLEIYPLPFEQSKIPVSMVYHRDKRKDAAHMWLREQLKKLALAATS